LKEQEFRVWMQEQGQAQSTVSTRLADARRVERHFGDLDEALKRDRFASILDDLAYSAEDNAAGKPNMSKIQIDGDAYKSLASYRSALSVYRQFCENEAEQSLADRIRDFVLKQIVEPARLAGESLFVVRAGDVHKQLGLQDRKPAVCNAIGGPKFQALAGVQLVRREGPENSSTTQFTFETVSSEHFNVSRAEAILRGRYGDPDVDNQKMISFTLKDGKAIALQKDISKVQLWLEENERASSPPAHEVQSYAAEKGRHSNLPSRLSHTPPFDLRNAGFPKPVLSVHTLSERELINVLDWYDGEGDGLNREALERLKALFLARYPEFEPLAFAARNGGYFDEERRYKDALMTQAQEALRMEPPLDDQALGAAFLDQLTGPESGLLGWRTDARIKKLRAAHPGVIERLVGKLAGSTGDLADAIADFVNESWLFFKEGQDKNLPYSETRNIPTMIAALAHPADAYGINTDPVMKTARALLGKPVLTYNPLSADEYRRVLHLMRAIKDVMERDWDWKPRDLWDVQGFIWAVNRADNHQLDDAARSLSGGGAIMARPTNLILYGPPGTGKTFATAEEAVKLCDGFVPSDRVELKARYDALVKAEQIAFVTFHQSYAYEDFVEGLRPVTGGEDGIESRGGGFRLESRKGVFRDISALAEQARKSASRSGGFEFGNRQFFKMSLGRAGSEDHIYDAAIEGGYIVLGWGGEINWSESRYEDYREIFNKWYEIEPGTKGNSGNISQVWRFRSSMREGDIVVVSEGNSNFRAIGEISGPYYYEPTGEGTYNHRRSVRWLLVLDEALPIDTIYDGALTMQSCYLLKEAKVKKEALSRLLPSDTPNASAAPDQFVLIIDEINRANISKVFGELITLIEPDKRLGESNELRLKLPYSGDTFGVPANLHIVGTMNTADRSVALLDTALRRRFRFKELMPNADLVSEDIEGINVRRLLQTLNDRIEYLFDREHQIGHAYFLGNATKEGIDEVMRAKIIPLLAEYFFENWERVRQVLGETQDDGGFIARRKLAPLAKGEADDVNERWRYTVRAEFSYEAYGQLTG
jgi:5-methylcytosine-specific restriction protein B